MDSLCRQTMAIFEILGSPQYTRELLSQWIICVSFDFTPGILYSLSQSLTLCLVEYRKVHIPAQFDDTDYIAKAQHKTNINMDKWLCFSCEVKGRARLFNYLGLLKEENFDKAVMCGVPAALVVPPPVHLKKGSQKVRRTKTTELPAHYALPFPPAYPL